MDRGDDAEPLLALDELHGAPLGHHDKRLRTRISHQCRAYRKPLGIGVVLSILLLVHISFVLLLRKTVVSLHQLTVPDMCHRESLGEIIVIFENPSYCSPDVGPLVLTFTKPGTQAFFQLELPSFTVQAGDSVIVADVSFRMLTTSEELHRVLFKTPGDVQVHGSVPVKTWCMLIPFTVNLDVTKFLGQQLQLASSNSSTSPLGSGELNQRRLGSVSDELERVVTQILTTIALSHIHVENDADEIIAFTDVSFVYSSRVWWNVPSLSIHVDTAHREPILLAGFQRFLLGNGKTYISAYTELLKNQTAPLQHMLQTFLAGNDVPLHVQGGNRRADCFSLEFLDLVDLPVKIPGKIDGQPALLRHYAVVPTLKRLDSKTHQCLLELKVQITVNNPLPIHFDLFQMELDLLYHSHKTAIRAQAVSSGNTTKFLAHIDDRQHIAWTSHEENNVTLRAQIRDFDICEDVIGLYFKDELVFSIEHGRIAMRAGTGNLTIPFAVDGIHIHPSSAQVAIAST